METPRYEAQVTTWKKAGWPSMVTINLETMSLEEITAALERLGPTEGGEDDRSRT